MANLFCIIYDIFQEYPEPTIKRAEIIFDLNVLINNLVPKYHKFLCDFHKRITKYNDYVIEFLYSQYVPPDNNGFKRAIRNVKVKQKISGQFKTEAGAQIYAIIRTVTDTCIKNGRNVLGAFKTIANLQAR